MNSYWSSFNRVTRSETVFTPGGDFISQSKAAWQRSENDFENIQILVLMDWDVVSVHGLNKSLSLQRWFFPQNDRFYYYNPIPTLSLTILSSKTIVVGTFAIKNVNVPAFFCQTEPEAEKELVLVRKSCTRLMMFTWSIRLFYDADLLLIDFAID